MVKRLCFLLGATFLLLGCHNNEKPVTLNITDNLEFIDIAVEEPGYHVWGSSPIIGPEGKTHLFVARWPKEYKVDPGWRSHSEVAHYVADKPEGPFTFNNVVLQGTCQDTWDKFGIHNPFIKQGDDTYYLFFMANNNPEQPPHPKNQRIGLAMSKSLYDSWEKAGENGMVLEPSQDPQNWNYDSGNGVSNPAFLPIRGICIISISNPGC